MQQKAVDYHPSRVFLTNWAFSIPGLRNLIQFNKVLNAEASQMLAVIASSRKNHFLLREGIDYADKEFVEDYICR